MNRDETIRMAAFLARSRVNGPGVRAVLWAQGCPIRCAGCFNPEFLPLTGGEVRVAEDVADEVLADTDTEGLTVSGGEPFAQAAGVAAVARAVRAAGKGVVVFTGYPWAELRDSEDRGWRALLAETDALIAGPYRAGLAVDRPPFGGAGKEIVCLTARYRAEDFRSDGRRRSEVVIRPDGTVTVTGFPGPGGPITGGGRA